MQVWLITTDEEKPLAIFFVLRELFEISRKIPVPEKGMCHYYYYYFFVFFSGLSRESGKVRRREQINRLFR